MLFAVTGFALLLRSLFARTFTSAAIALPNGNYVVIGWLGMGALICFLYAILYYTGEKLLKLNVPISLSLLHLLIAALTVVGFGIGTTQVWAMYHLNDLQRLRIA